MVTAKPKKTSPTWIDVKAKVADFDRAGLLGVLQDLYAGSKDNQAFLHARFGLGVDALEPYKNTINRWLWPDVLKNQSTSVSAAKKAIADYKRATGQPEGLARLTTLVVAYARSSRKPQQEWLIGPLFLLILRSRSAARAKPGAPMAVLQNLAALFR
jgi:hypothetical protein